MGADVVGCGLGVGGFALTRFYFNTEFSVILRGMLQTASKVLPWWMVHRHVWFFFSTLYSSPISSWRPLHGGARRYPGFQSGCLPYSWLEVFKSPLRRKVRYIVADLKSSVSLRFLTLRFDKSQSSALDAWSNQNSKFPLGRRIPLDSPTQLQSHQWAGSFKREMPALGESISIFTTSLQPWHENASPHTAVSFVG